ncbi:MAG TPA: response regulator [Oligoflexia bacterium]|nr:response regulator [Oligoflexia bacterium]HMP47964.1 response regulator [Oligoflexia bacterium]
MSQKSAEKSPYRASSKGTALIIDDDEEILATLSSTLRPADLDIVTLPSAMHALKYIDSQRWEWYPRLVICDLAMPRMGGFLFIKRLNELFPKKKITTIICSYLNSGLDVNEAEIAGASAYLMKPLNTKLILSTVETVLSNKKSSMILVEPDKQ